MPIPYHGIPNSISDFSTAGIGVAVVGSGGNVPDAYSGKMRVYACVLFVCAIASGLACTLIAVPIVGGLGLLLGPVAGVIVGILIGLPIAALINHYRRKEDDPPAEPS
ncbi:MAG: hypothetical protein DHS20C14_06270 [Phycisphaeraceae bacterium]|nr:MAG: hypothetical protein DHS20C14_06270 [Phycisphaeraceae bacterium]